MSDYLAKAIKKLKPNAEFTFTEDDYSTIQWIVLEGNAPTKGEIANAIEEIKTDEISSAETKTIQRQAILDRLGITAEEAALLLS
jgi:hypothetical protein